MRDSVLVKILKTFDSKDIKDFRKFLQSPFHTESKLLLEFFDYLRRFQPEYTSHRLKKENLFTQFFSDKNYTDSEANKRLINMSSQLKQLIEEYLALREFRKDKIMQKRLVAQVYSDLGDYDLFKGKLDEGFKELEKVKYQDEDYYLEKVLFHDLEYYHPQTYQYKKNGDSMSLIMNSLDDYFILHKLKGWTDLVTRKHLFSGDFHIELLKEIQELINKKGEDGNPRFHLYPLVIETFQNAFTDPAYLKLKSAFIKYKASLNPIEQKGVWTCLFNYYAKLIRGNKDTDEREIWELQKIALEDGFLLANEKISRVDFENIVIVSSTLKEFVWTKEFIEEYALSIPVEERENSVNLSWTKQILLM